MLMGVDHSGEHVLSPEYPSTFCHPCYEGVPVDAEWPRRLKPEYEGLPTTACGFARMPDGSLVSPDEMYL